MYKILIVDDEKWIRKGLIAKLLDNGFAFSWIGEATDGKAALMTIEEELPDIVITDIRMPNMDGLQLIEAIRELNLNIKFIIISGYAEFEYAEKAVNIGVCGYILKPLSDENLVKVINRAIKDLEETKNLNQVIQLNKHLQKDNEKMLQERLFNQILHSPNEYDDKTMEYVDSVVNLKNYKYCMLVLIHIDSSNYGNSSFMYEDLELIKFSAKNILNELYPEAQIFNNQKDLNQVFVLLFSNDKEELSRLCSRFTLDAYTKMTKYLNVVLTIGLSDIGQNITNELLKQSKAAFDLRLINGSNKVYRYEKFELGQNLELPKSKLNLLRKCMETYNFNDLATILNELFSKENLKSYTGVYLRYLYFEIINILLSVCTNSNIDIESSIDSEILTGEILDSFSNNTEVVRFLYTTIIDILKVEIDPNTNCREMVNKAIEYITQNYFLELTAKDLAKKNAINSNYFSIIFKQITGETFTKYISDLRIQKACELLKITKMGVTQIAQSVGYQDTQYFYRVFKKVTGKTPFEYRDL